MRVRTAGPGDVAALVALHAPQAGTPARDEQERRELVRTWVSGALGWCFVAEVAGEIAGSVLLRPARLLGHDTLESLLVAPPRRRAGMAGALVTAAAGAAATDQVVAAVPRGDLGARAVLAGHGWQVAGRLTGLAAQPLVVLRRTASPTLGPGRLFHLALREEWDRAVREGAYRRSTLGSSLDEVGFVHASFAHQVPGVAATHYAGVGAPLVLLEIDRARLSSRVLVEEAVGTDEVFPHVYGPVDVAAVHRVTPLSRDGAGALIVP